MDSKQLVLYQNMPPVRLLHRWQTSRAPKHARRCARPEKYYQPVRSRGLGREALGTECLVEWQVPFSFPRAWSCQRKFRALNSKATSSISFCSHWKKARREAENEIRKGSQHIFISFTVARRYFISNGRWRKWAKRGVSRRGNLQAPRMLLSQTPPPPPTPEKWKKFIEVTERTQEILAG